MADEYDPTKKSGKLLPQSKTTLKQRMAKVDKYFSLDPKVRSKLRKAKYDSLSDTQKKTLSGVKTAAQVASYFLPGGALRLAVPIVRGIQAAKTGFKVGNKTYKTLKEAKAAKDKLKKVIPSKLKTKDPKTGKERAVPDTDKTKRATQSLKTKEAKNLTAQKDALKARQDKTTKILKGSSNVALAAATAATADKFRNKKTVIKKKPKAKLDSVLSRKRNIDTRRSPGALGGRVKTKETKPRTRQQVLKTIGKSRPISKAEPPQLKKPMSKAEPPQLVGPAKEVKTKKTTDIKGPAKTVYDAQDRGLDTFTNKKGKVLAAITKEQLAKSGKGLTALLNAQKKSGKSLTKYLESEGIRKRKPTTKKMGGGKVYRRGGGKALRGFGKATYSNKPY